MPFCFLHCYACLLLPMVHISMSAVLRLDFWYLILMTRPFTTPLALSSNGENPSLLSKALQDLGGAREPGAQEVVYGH